MTNAHQDRQDEGISPGEQRPRPAGTQVPDAPLVSRSGRARRWASLAAGVAILALGGGAIFWQWQDKPASASIEAGPQAQTFVVQPQAVSQQLDMTGTIAAGKSIAIVAPFDGVIREKRVQLGDTVKAGDVLVVMDTSEIAGRYRDAQSAYLKAAMAADTLKTWQTGPDMLRAKRSLESAQGSLATLERQVNELKGLLDQGIVSRNEYDGVVQQRDAQKSTVDGAADELAATQARGNDENRELLALDLENAQSRLADLKTQMAGASVATAVAGILTRPPLNAAKQEPVSIEPGASVTRGAALFAIADTSGFTVTGNVDEIDINRVRIGQPVTIANDAFFGQPMTGKIVNISAEADIASSGSTPKFQVRASFSVPDEALRSAIKLGMSARMTVETYSNQAAIILPPSAILRSDKGTAVRVRRNGEENLIPIVLGATVPAGVEVISGLSTGEEVILAQ